MLRDENLAFSEEEVGGAWAQPHPPAAHSPLIHSAAVSADLAGASLTAKSRLSCTDAKRTNSQHVTASPPSMKQPSASVNTPQSSHHAIVHREEEGKESAFTVPAADAQHLPLASVDATAMRAAWLGPHQTSLENTGNAGPDERPWLATIGATDVHVDPGHAHMSTAAALRDAAMDEELFDNDDGGVVVRATPRSSSSQSRSGYSSRGPPVAAIMDAPVFPVASTTTMMSVLASTEGRNGSPFLRELPRPGSCDSISFSIQSSSSSSSSHSIQVDEKDAEEGCRSSPVTLANEYAQEAKEAQRAAMVETGADGRLTPAESGAPLSYVSNANYHNNDNSRSSVNGSGIGALGSGSAHVSESAHSSPTAVTLWGVHRDLRRKRIKKVSHYILGSLLGEGAYGVVRDCIDINTDNPNRRFQRCAIKIINGNYAKVDMPAIFGHRSRSTSSHNNNNIGPEGEGASMPDPAASSSLMPARGMLKRTTGGGGAGGMRYHREDDQRRQENFQREMRNLQRFHCKNIIRALDSFTRYSKEYVVLPIAICSVQQLVRQLMRTRWREAVREWRRRQRKLLRTRDGQQQQQQQQQSMSSRGLPLVPSSVSMLDLDDLTFMEEDDFDFEDDDHDEDDEDSVNASEDAREGTQGGTLIAVHPTAGATPSYDHQCEVQDRDDARHSSGSLSDHDDDDQMRGGRGDRTRSRQQSSPTRSTASLNVNGNASTSHRRMLPRVPSSNSNTTTTTTTGRTIDSYDNGNSNSNDARAVSRGQQRGGEDESSDLSSTGVNNNNNACMQVMSATPTMQDDVRLPGKPARATGALGVGDRSSSGVGSSSQRRSGAVSVETSKTAGISSTCAPQHDDARPHLVFPMCSTTLLKGIFYQVISGVDYLHQQNLAHNDIKPSNVLLFEDGTVKLGDLGSVSDTFNDQGTPLCASPELCRYFYGAATPPASFSQSTETVGRDAAKPSDMWCCGLLLYYLITGKPGPLPVQLRYFQSLHSKQHHHNASQQQQQQPSLHAARRQQQQRRHSSGSSSGGASARGEDKLGGEGTTTPTTAVPSSLPPPPVTRYQLYREIASQTAPVDLSDLPDMIPPDLGDDVAVATEQESGLSTCYPKASVRDLLAGLLELNPQHRLTAEQALRHPWLRMTFRLKPNEREVKRGRRGNGAGGGHSAAANGEEALPTATTRKTPSKQAMEDAIQRDVARRVTESRHVQRMLLMDRQRHLQFVADCCNMLNLSIPPEIIRVQPAEPYREDVGPPAVTGPNIRGGLVVATSPAASRSTPQQQRNAAAAAMAAAMVGGGRNTSRVHRLSGNHSSSTPHPLGGDAAAAGTVVSSSMTPAVMPAGCVDTELFLPHAEEDYYEQKSGKSEFDVRVLRRKPLLMAQLDEYFHNVVLVQCGYRTGPDPNYQAMRVRAVPIEDQVSSGGGGSGRRRNGSDRGGSGSNGSSSGGGRGNTQQPSVVILPGASSNVYRRSPSIGVSQLANVEGENANANFDVLGGGGGGARVEGDDAAAAIAAEDVWGAGPRHQPRVHVDEHGNVVSTQPHFAAAAGPSATTAMHSPMSSKDAAAATSANAMATTTTITSTNRPPQRNSFGPAPVQTTVSSSNNNNNNNIGNPSRSSGSTRPAVSVSSSSNDHNHNHNSANASSGGGHRRGTVDTTDAQEVMGTAVVNTARASGMHGSGRRSGAQAATTTATQGGRHTNRSPREGSESASEAEQNVAMRESSKCLCGLM